MARLNESTASAEPIEILKRRFVRQNREIARVNSIQSLRIRSLESEVSHLLSENVTLREQIITLTQDLERFEAARTLHDGVYDVKGRLDSKLLELGSLITELGSLPRRYTRTAREKGEPVVERQPRVSSSSEQANDGDEEPQPITEVDGRLPVILEDKYYPRPSLSGQDGQDLPNSGGSSPSSPEVNDPAQSPEQIFEYEETETSAPLAATAASAPLDYTEEHILPPNLETRRKKRIGSTTVDQERTDRRSTSLLDSRFTRKCGAKRKFSVEDEESLFETADAEDDGFKFSRPAQPELTAQIDLSPQHGPSPTKRKTQLTEVKKHAPPPKRKVLEPKSTNMSTLSPVKRSNSKTHDHHPNKPILEDNENSVPRLEKGGVKRSKPTSPKKPSTPVPHFDAGTSYPKPETTVIDLPQLDAEHSELPVATDVSNTRTSRRRGAVVSYAEPNLRDKMRRSTNELGPAVSRDKLRKSSLHADSAQELEQGRKSSSTKKARNSSMTSEAHDSNGYEDSDEHGTAVTKRHSYARVDASGAQEFGSQDARSARSFEDPSYDGGLYERRRTSGPPDGSVDNGSNILGVDEAVSVTSRKSRRHSSNTKSSGRAIPSDYITSTFDMESVCNELVNDLSTAEEFSARDSQEYKGASAGSDGVTRGQRVAARRRSMML